MSNITLKQIFLSSILITFFISGCNSKTERILPSPSVAPTENYTADATLPAPSPTAYPVAQPTEIEPTLSPTITPTRDSTQPRNDRASFVGENYPDYSILEPGAEFVKTFDIKNIGSSSWLTSYSLTLLTSSSGIYLSSPDVINFPKTASPEETINISIALVAPSTPGAYTVSWNLKNELGETIPIDGGVTVWATILVCEPNQPCNRPPLNSNTTIGQISASLSDYYSTDTITNVSFCMTLPNRNYGPGAGTVYLLVDQEESMALGGGSLSIGCYEFNFPYNENQINQASKVSLSIGHVRFLGGVNYPDATCQTARETLILQYPGLDFDCQFSGNGYHTNLSLPSNLTVIQAEQLIFDTIEGAVYGPWILPIK